MPGSNKTRARSDTGDLLRNRHCTVGCRQPAQFPQYGHGQCSMRFFLKTMSDTANEQIRYQTWGRHFVQAKPFVAQLRRRHRRQRSQFVLELCHLQAAIAMR